MPAPANGHGSAIPAPSRNGSASAVQAPFPTRSAVSRSTAISIGATHAPASTALTTPMKNAKSPGHMLCRMDESEPRFLEKSMKKKPNSARERTRNRTAMAALNQGFP